MTAMVPTQTKRKPRRRPLSPAKLALRIFQYATLIIFSIIVLLPLWSILMSALKTQAEYITTNHITPPQNWFNFENFKAVLFPAYGPSLILAFANTVIVLLCSIFLLVIFGSMAAFVLDRFKFRGRLVILGAYAALVAVPGILTPIATFQVLQFLGLVNTKWALVVLYSGADIVSLLIFIQFIRSISTEIDDSARLEGASYFTIFFRLILPMLSPAITTVAILRSVYIYNDFVFPYLYANRMEDTTVSMMLYNFTGLTATVSQTVVAASVVLVILPTLTAFFFVQKYIYAGITQGSVKG